jgi:hypothetical protein
MNFAPEPRRVDLGGGGWKDAVSGEEASARMVLPAFGVRVLRIRERQRAGRREGGVRAGSEETGARDH